MFKRMSHEEFIRKAIKAHGYKYDYSLTKYKRSTEKVTIICRDHGKFDQVPSDHLRGRGCWHCREKAKISKDEFVKRAILKHGDRYKYDNVIHESIHDKVIITCKIHGNFMQAAYSHLAGHNCPKCQNKDSFNGWRLSEWEAAGLKSKHFDGFKLYLILIKGNLEGEYFLKIGRTFRSVSKRFRGLKLKYKVISTFSSSAKDVFKKEVHLRKILKQYSVTPSSSFGGMHECFSISALDMAMSEFDSMNNVLSIEV